jgi:hypothetical protein
MNIPAYIDPNTGGMLFQILAASFAAVSGLLLLFSRQIRVLVSRIKRVVRERLGGTDEVTGNPTDETA